MIARSVPWLPLFKGTGDRSGGERLIGKDEGLLPQVFVAHVGMSVRGFQPANDKDLEITVVQFRQNVMDRFPALGDEITVTRVQLPPGAGENLEQRF